MNTDNVEIQIGNREITMLICYVNILKNALLINEIYPCAVTIKIVVLFYENRYLYYIQGNWLPIILNPHLNTAINYNVIATFT